MSGAGQQYARALLAAGDPGYSLEQVHPRTLKPLSQATDMTQPGAHTFGINHPERGRVGLVDTEWHPATGALHIADIQSDEGTRSLGASAIRQIRDHLIARYPGVRSLTGRRITGATYNDTMSGVGPGRVATQRVR